MFVATRMQRRNLAKLISTYNIIEPCRFVFLSTGALADMQRSVNPPSELATSLLHFFVPQGSSQKKRLVS